MDVSKRSKTLSRIANAQKKTRVSTNLSQKNAGVRLHMSKNTETSIYALPVRGSYSVEAAIIIPLIAGFFISILMIFRMIQIQMVVDEKLIFTSRKIAVMSTISNSEVALFTAAETMFRTELEDERITKYVSHGEQGISLLTSEFSGEYIDLCAVYEISIPVSFFGIDSIRMFQHAVSRKWIGSQLEEDKSYVYVTETGTIYHMSKSCRALSISACPVRWESISKLRNVEGKKYYPCASCITSGKKYAVVYVTDYGTEYHESLECHSLKRNIKAILFTEVNGYKCCKWCAHYVAEVED